MPFDPPRLPPAGFILLKDILRATERMNETLKFRRILLSALMLLICAFSRMPALAGDQPFLLTAGGSFAYCRDGQGTLWVYGDNQFGQLGKGGKAQSKKPAVFKSKNAEIDPAEIRAIYAGCDYSFFLMNDGSIYGVGNNAYNPLLIGTNRSMATTHVHIPLEDRTIVKMACGFGQVLALNEAGEVWAWGRNSDGQVGCGTTKKITAPQKLALSGIVDIAAGGKFSLALDRDGVLWGWGKNESHQLSNGKEKYFTTPIRVEIGDIRPAMIDAGGETVSVVDTEGRLWMWGRNDVQQIGIDTKGSTVLEPRLFEELPAPVMALDSYNSQTYVILTDGSLWGWGNNRSGQLGLGRKTTGSPVSMIWPADVIHVTSFDVSMNCVLADGRVLACGSNKFGQFGNGAVSDFHIPQIRENGMVLFQPGGAAE